MLAEFECEYFCTNTGLNQHVACTSGTEDGGGECEDALEALIARMMEAKAARKHCGRATACGLNSMGAVHAQVTITSRHTAAIDCAMQDDFVKAMRILIARKKETAK